jgi:hypothetical protein
MIELAAQYGGADATTSTQGTRSGDMNSPPREVPTLLRALESVLFTDTAMSARKPRERYTRRENARRMKVRRRWLRQVEASVKEPEETEATGEAEEEDPRWNYWIPPCALEFEVRVHGKVVRPKRPARVNSVGDSAQSPVRGVHNFDSDGDEQLADTNLSERVYSVEEIATHVRRAAEESQVWERLSTGTPDAFAAYQECGLTKPFNDLTWLMILNL